MYDIQPEEYNAEFNYINEDVRFAYVNCIDALKVIHENTKPTYSQVRNFKSTIIELIYVLIPLDRKNLEIEKLEPMLNATLNINIRDGVCISFLKKTLFIIGIMMGKAKLYKRTYGKQDTVYKKRFKSAKPS